MIITWYTDPSKGNFAENPGKFSSYYQYDTTTNKLVRVRLELGRETSEYDTGATTAFLDDQRYVGFSTVVYIEKEAEYPDEDFTIDAKSGLILVKGEALDVKPKIGDNVVDMSSYSETPHFGNSVSKNINLPEGIETKHLSLIANEAIITNKNIIISGRNASGVELSGNLKAKVCDIVGKEDFASISDEDILKALKSQVSEIKTRSIAPSKESIEGSLEEVEDVLKSIRTEIEEGRITPNESFTEAFSSFSDSVAKAKTALSESEGIKAATEELASEKAKLLSAAKTLVTEQQYQAEDIISKSDKAIETAQSESETWEAISSEYEEVESAETIEDYEKSIGNVEEEPVEI